jgi:electron transfer flavoprotein beta subunit
VTARREAPGGGWESFDLPLPAIVSVKEGINLPRYPSVPGRLRARKKEIERSTPAWQSGGLEKILLRLPQTEATAAEVIGRGPDAAPAVVDLLVKLGVLGR